METYYLKRYRRSSPATSTDTLEFSAASTEAARSMAKRYLNADVVEMNSDTHFGALEDVSGKVLETWPGSQAEDRK
jgi:hypothetical protein